MNNKAVAAAVVGALVVVGAATFVVTRAPVTPTSTTPSTPERARAEELAREGQRLIMSGDAEAARVKCEEAVKVDANFSQGYNCIGVTYYFHEHYAEALAAYQKALALDASNHDAAYNIGCLFALQGKTEEALAALQSAVRHGYNDFQSFRVDKDLSSLRGNPAFEKLARGDVD